MDERIERVLTRATEAEQVEVKILSNAMAENLKKLHTDKSAAVIDSYEKAKRALTRTVDGLWSKYFDQDEPFKTRIEALAYIQGEGYKLKKSKLYLDTERGLLRVQPDGTVRFADVREYIAVAGLKKLEDKSGKMIDDQAMKVKNENRQLVLKNEKLEFELGQIKGEYLRKTDVQNEFAGKIGATEATTKNRVRIRMKDYREAPSEDAAILLFNADFDDILAEMGDMEELKITIHKAMGHGL